MGMTSLNLARVFCSISSGGSAVLLYYGWKPSRSWCIHPSSSSHFSRYRTGNFFERIWSLWRFQSFSAAMRLLCSICFPLLACNPRLFIPPPPDYYFPPYYNAFNIAYKCLADSFCWHAIPTHRFSIAFQFLGVTGQCVPFIIQKLENQLLSHFCKLWYLESDSNLPFTEITGVIFQFTPSVHCQFSWCLLGFFLQDFWSSEKQQPRSLLLFPQH